MWWGEVGPLRFMTATKFICTQDHIGSCVCQGPCVRKEGRGWGGREIFPPNVTDVYDGGLPLAFEVLYVSVYFI